MTKISIVTPTYNEEENIEKLCLEIRSEMKKIEIDYEHIVIDNSSTDKTVEILRKICKNDKNVKVIINSKNFGHIRSPYYGLLQSSGDACILMASDFQDPVDMIAKYVDEWKKGSKIVLGKKITSEENSLIFFIRNFFSKYILYK